MRGLLPLAALIAAVAAAPPPPADGAADAEVRSGTSSVTTPRSPSATGRARSGGGRRAVEHLTNDVRA